jgi:recombinational DNA repair ATPase RecF
MRIQKLSIKNYKNLEDFTWEINPNYPVAVIVGKNGSGKTNLLEAIISIFQDLQLHGGNRKPRFPAFTATFT